MCCSFKINYVSTKLHNICKWSKSVKIFTIIFTFCNVLEPFQAFKEISINKKRTTMYQLEMSCVYRNESLNGTGLLLVFLFQSSASIYITIQIESKAFDRFQQHFPSMLTLPYSIDLFYLLMTESDNQMINLCYQLRGTGQ